MHFKCCSQLGYANLHPIALSRTQKQDPAEYSSVVAPEQYLSLTQYTQQRVLAARSSDLPTVNRIGIGRIAHTGYTENCVPTAQLRGRDPSELLTTYRAVHGSVSAGENRSYGGVRPAVPGGFTKATRVHHFGPPLNSAATLRKQDAYVAR